MKRLLNPLVLLSILLILLGSCLNDPKKEPDDSIEDEDTYQNLKEKDDVLINLELSYNDQDITQYLKILDEDESVFIFAFSPEDFAAGKTPKFWGRTKELEITSRIFRRGGSDPIKNISLNLSYPKGDVTWEEASTPAGHENENWFQKFVTYDLAVETTSGQTYYARDSRALYVIRYSFNSIAEDTVWQIVQWYDLGQ